MRAAYVEQARSLDWQTYAAYDFAAQHHSQRGQASIVTLQCRPHFWTGGVILVGHMYHRLIGAHYFWQVLPDRDNIRAVDNIGRDIRGRAGAQPTPRDRAIAIAPPTHA